MKNYREIASDVYFIGCEDPTLYRFENIFPLSKGVSYNAYVVLDEKTIAFDTVDDSVGRSYLENLQAILHGRSLDYLVVSHMEPDHCALIQDVIQLYPDVTLIGNMKTFTMIDQFFTNCEAIRMIVKENDILCTGKHSFTFIMAPFVHWPEVMVTYDSYSKILFSADAFGTFNTLNGAVFNDEIDFEKDYLEEARRYYTNIVGKYGPQVQMLLKKASALDIEMIAPLHGLVWRNNLDYIIQKYNLWSTYTSEQEGVLIIYGTVYGNTQEAMYSLARKLHENGMHQVKMYDVCHTHQSYIIADIFKYSHIILAAPTYNGTIFPAMETLLADMQMLNVQNKQVVVFDNGSWAPISYKKIEDKLSSMKNMNLLCSSITFKSVYKDEGVLDSVVQLIKQS